MTAFAIGLAIVAVNLALILAMHRWHWRDPEELDEPERTLEPGPRWGR